MTKYAVVFCLAFGANAASAAKSPRVVIPKSIVKPAVTQSFVQTRAQKVLAALKSRPVRGVGIIEKNEIAAGTSKNDWLKAVYSKNLVESSWATEMLSDKRILAEVLKMELGERAKIFYPKTIGLKEFLRANSFINPQGKIAASGEQIEEALYREFPAGFLVRPAVGVAPQERGKGLYPETDLFIVDLLKPNSPLYNPVHAKQQVRSSILNAIASGEAIVLQENFVAVSDAKKPLKNRFFNEVRVHTYEGKTVEGAVPERWVQKNLMTPMQQMQAEAFAGEFLKALPLNILTKQAWGVDVAVLDNGEMKIIDVVTNRGIRGGSWSGYLDQPRVIGAYTRHFERHYGVRFKGVSGTLLRNNFANYMPYWEKRIEKAKPGLVGKLTAYLPPLP